MRGTKRESSFPGHGGGSANTVCLHGRIALDSAPAGRLQDQSHFTLQGALRGRRVPADDLVGLAGSLLDPGLASQGGVAGCPAVASPGHDVRGGHRMTPAAESLAPHAPVSPPRACHDGPGRRGRRSKCFARRCSRRRGLDLTPFMWGPRRNERRLEVEDAIR